MKSQVAIISKKVEIGNNFKDAVNKVFESFEKYNLNIISRKAIISKNKQKEIEVELVLELKGKHSIIIKSKNKDIYEALIDATERVEKALRRLSDKIKNHKKNISLRDLAPEEAVLHTDTEKTIDEEINDLVPMEMTLKKPIDIEDAIMKLRGNKNIQFFVFNDRSGNTRTIYKRADGKIGIY